MPTPPIRRLLRPVAAALLLVLAACTPAPAAVGPVDGPEAHRLVTAGALLLDVRTPDEFSSRHIPGALNIPVDELPGRLAEVPEGRDVIVYCASGARSARAAKQLREAGRTRVRDLGSLANW